MIITTFISGYQSVLLSIIKNSVIKFIYILPTHSILSYYGAISHEKVHFPTTKSCNWKTIYCFFLNHLHWIYFDIFFSRGYAWKTEWMKMRAEKNEFKWMRKKSISPTLTPDIDVEQFFTSTLLTRYVDLIRSK